MAPEGQKVLQIGDWRVAVPECAATRQGETVHLEPKAMEVLVYLATRPGDVVSREDLEREVWRGALVGYDAVTSTVIKLRKALGDNARQPRYIATIPKRGYQLIAPVSHPEEEPAQLDVRPTQAATTPPVNRGERGASRKWVWVGAGLVVLIGLGLALLQMPTADRPSAGESPRVELPDNAYSLVVLPFENRSDDPAQEAFADGITEDIITDLSRLSNLLVIASNTAFTYKGRQIAAQAVGAELGVAYVLEGSVRRAGDAIRVNAQLVDASTGFQRWAERYDRQVTEVFAVQDEVTNSIVEALAVKLTSQERERLARVTTRNLQAYDYFQEGQRLAKVSTAETNRQAQEAYRKAIELDPSYGRAYGALAYTLAFAFRRGWTDMPQEALDRALALARQAVELDDSIPQPFWALGYVHLFRKEYEQAAAAAQRSITIAPNYADGYGLLALISNSVGDAQKAADAINTGMRLNPYYTWDYPYNLGRAYYALGRYEEAVPLLEAARQRNEYVVPIRLHLAASYVRVGRLDDAEWEVSEIQMLSPAETISHLKRTNPIQAPDLMASFLEDLRRAGLPE